MSAAAILALASLGCGSGESKPATPTQPTVPAAPTLTAIVVGVAGNAPATLAPGDKLQLFAQGQYSDGATSDLTNVATWQSTNPVAATVSSGGVLSAATEGEVDVSASYAGRAASLHAQVQKPGCQATVSPSSLVFSAFGSLAELQVTTTRSDCRWIAKSDASWLPLNYDPNRSGSGSFTYSVPSNSGNEPRRANIVITIAGGPPAMHVVEQERPVSCSYAVSPEKLTLPSSGGRGSFDLVTTPSDCRWTLTSPGDYSSVKITVNGPAIGAGAAHFDYTIGPNTFASGLLYRFEIHGLSGTNPPGVHSVTLSGK